MTRVRCMRRAAAVTLAFLLSAYDPAIAAAPVDPDIAAVRTELGENPRGILVIAPEEVETAALSVVRAIPMVLAERPPFGAWSLVLGEGRGCLAVAPLRGVDLPRLLAAGPPPPGAPDTGLLRRMLIRHEVVHCLHPEWTGRADEEALADAEAARLSLAREADGRAVLAAIRWLAVARDLGAARTGIHTHDTGPALRRVLADRETPPRPDGRARGR